MDRKPTISVIIPTYNRAASLRETLESLAQQSYPADCFEVIVVDDGSTDDTEEMLATFKPPYPLRVITQENRGAASARNRGALESRGTQLVFIDDDITLGVDYLSALETIHCEESGHVIAMGTFGSWPLCPRTPFQRIIVESAFNTTVGKVCFTECTSNNVSILHEDFFALGMWQDVAGDGATLWGDVEFGYRAHRKGFRFIRSAAAILYHRDYAAADLGTACRRSEYAARLATVLFQKYPELVTMLPMFRDKMPIDLAADPPALVIRKLLRKVASSRPAVWGMEQLVRQLERYLPQPWLLRPLYRWIIGAYIFRGYREGLRRLRESQR